VGKGKGMAYLQCEARRGYLAVGKRVMFPEKGRTYMIRVLSLISSKLCLLAAHMESFLRLKMSCARESAGEKVIDYLA